MSNFKSCGKKNTNKPKTPVLNTSVQFFTGAFQNRLGCTPDQYIAKKLDTGSRVDDIKYLYNMIASEIAHRNNCKCFEFDYFYRNHVVHPMPPLEKKVVTKTTRPENAGKFWTREEERLLVQMYNSSATKQEMCAAFKRTEVALAARLVRLGIIESRDVFRSSKR